MDMDDNALRVADLEMHVVRCRRTLVRIAQTCGREDLADKDAGALALHTATHLLIEDYRRLFPEDTEFEEGSAETEIASALAGLIEHPGLLCLAANYTSGAMQATAALLNDELDVDDDAAVEEFALAAVVREEDIFTVD